MKIEYYYYVYSAMTQAAGALIAFVGIFIIFKINIQRQRLEDAYKRLGERVCGVTEYPSTSKIYEKAENFLEKEDNKKNPHFHFIKELKGRIDKQIEILDTTRKVGKLIIIRLSLLFLFYILALNLNMDIFNKLYLRILVLWVGLLLSIYILSNIVNYITNCLKQDDR